MFMLQDSTIGNFDLDDTSNGVVLTEKDFGFPAVREVVDDYPDNHGVVDRTAFFGQRVISCSGYIVDRPGKPRSETLNTIRSYCMPFARPTLKFQIDSSAGTYYATLRVDNQSIPVINSVNFKFNMTWKTDPFFRGDDQSGTTGHVGSGITSQSLWTVPFFPMDFALGSGSSLNAANTGMLETWPIIKIYGPLTNPTVTNLTNNRQIKIDGLTLNAGTEYILINTKTRTVSYGSSGTSLLSYVDYAVSSWFPLSIGANTLTLDGSGPTGDTLMIVEWNNLFL